MGKLFHKDKPLAGLDISTTGIKIMAVDPRRMVVVGYGSVDLDPTKVQEGMTKADDYLADGLKYLLKEKLVGRLPSNQVALSVPTSRTYSRTMTLPNDAAKNIREAVQLEVEQYVPIAPADLNIDYEVLSKDKKETTVLLAAVPKKIVSSAVQTCQKAGLQVVMVEPAMNATARLMQATEEGHLPSIIVDIGAATSDIGLLDNGAVRLTGSVAVGGHSFTLAISEKLKIPLEEAHQLKIHSGLANGPNRAKVSTALEQCVSQIIVEIRKIIRYYNERIGVKTKIEQVIIVGGGSNMPGIGDAITDAILMPARVADPWHIVQFGRLTPPTKQFKPRYTTAAGLTLVSPKEIWA